MTSMLTSTEIEIIPLLPEHRQSVINLLISSFFIEEPINAILQYDIPNEILTWSEYLVDQALYDQCSFVAIEITNLHKNVVGLILNGISDRKNNPEPISVQSEKLNFVFSVIDQVFVGYDLFEYYKTDRLFHCDIINIDENQRRQNLSSRLILASIDKARQLNLTGAYVVCTSLYSRKAFERQGFKMMNEIFYSDYGQGRLMNMGEHDRCTLLVRQL